jgi:glutamate dehydrogenase
MATGLATRTYGLEAIGAAAGGEEAQAFARRLYERVAAKDLAGATAEQRAAAALSLLAFAKRRLPGVAKVRVFNPTSVEHGFESAHTVVQIVNDDMPFLVDSIANELNRRELTIHLLAHPVFSVRRDVDGDLQSLTEAEGQAPSESMMQVEIDRQADDAQREDLAAALGRVLSEVRHAVGDWRAMRGAALDAVEDLEPAHAVEEQEFLRWLEANHFTFLGYRRYRYVEDGAQAGGLRYEVIPGSALGILRRDDLRLFDAGLGAGEAMARFARGPQPLLIVKTDRESMVHRRGAMDCVIVKTHDAQGAVTGERRFVGHFTSTAYHEPALDVPLLRGRVESVLVHAGLDPSGHDGKALLAILDAYPRDELFQIDTDTLYQHAMGILQLQERHRVALFVRRDPVGRFASCLVFAPRERFDNPLNERIRDILQKAWHGTVTSITGSGSTDSALAQALYTLKLDKPDSPTPDLGELEQALAEAATSWTDRFETALNDRAAVRKWRDWFPTVYRDTYDAAQAKADVAPLQAALEGSDFGVRLGRRASMPAHRFTVRLFHPRKAIALSDILPLAENLGLRVLSEAPFRLQAPSNEQGGSDGVALQVLRVETADKSPVDLAEAGPRFMETLEKLWAGDLENDGLNKLVLKAGLAWREVALLRSYAKYLRQAGIPFSQEYMERALVAYPELARGTVELFEARFDPNIGSDRQARIDAVERKIAAALEGVATLDEDRILRRFLNAVQCSLRTNYWHDKEWISFKVDSRTIDELPAPRPLFEIFVYSPRMEGIHLRGGRVARGGIRWSDRREDFRTEILGLMKTQVVKNAVIVPTGSKGGFYVKRPPTDGKGGNGTREQILAEGIFCYQTLMRGMLDITDNYVEGKVVPADCVRYDPDDPYLVVAADKGTATFSDIANALAREYGFWLDDAFASGGSAGYDHKKIGITARGAWESVKRHFRELGVDIQKTPFSVVGVGDMSGDVFGNGMLLSTQTKLLAAFDHRHIFVDPTPDPARSWAERKRLFDLPRSSWMDYDKSLISAGGGVFDRNAKSITLSAQASAALGIEQPVTTPSDLMRAILKAPADLLYFGGIGTYVKASSESNADAGDRANDPIRIDANDLRAKVIGEGANLGFTQRGRVEAALTGRKINTDALDNSAGVDTSDHEVNIKIAIGGTSDRDQLLFAMTDEVANLVLRHNYQQSQAISVAEAQAADEHDRMERFMRALERPEKGGGRLDRAVEYLPDTVTMRARAANKQWLTRPELSVLLAYAKIDLTDQILDSSLPDDPLLEEELVRYFPTTLQQKFDAELRHHRLRREIATLQVVNSLVNRCGPTFVRTVAQRTGASAAAIAHAFAVVRDAWKLRDLWVEIEALDGTLKAEAQIRMLVASQRFMLRTVQWVLRRLPQPIDTLDATRQLGAVVAALDDLPSSLIGEAESATLNERAAAFEMLGAPPDTARRASALETLASAGDLMLAAKANGCTIEEAARLHFQLGERLSLARLEAAAHKLPRDGQWPAQAAIAMNDELAALHADLLNSVLKAGGDLTRWGEGRPLALERVDRLKEEMAVAGPIDLNMLSVAASELRSLV